MTIKNVKNLMLKMTILLFPVIMGITLSLASGCPGGFGEPEGAGCLAP
ncbi:MAG: hypothetical protein GPJ54_03045 [Candidatus Heimdallarchaeota archaeon]|nr:hypothetical protein [Candidatus Heimdallarchaeota archaeon]